MSYEGTNLNTLAAGLIRYGWELVAGQLGKLPLDWSALGVLGQEIAVAPTDPRLIRAREFLGDDGQFAPGARVRAIFDLVLDADGRASHVRHDRPQGGWRWAGQPEEQDKDTLWSRCLAEGRQIRSSPKAFETFLGLMSLYARGLPSTLRADFRRSFDPDGVSVYEQFKLTAALAYSLALAETDQKDLWLVAGDVSGIQDTLYTLTSEGAARSLRGRSFYLQLLPDATVRVLRRQFELGPWHVLYLAGGNFMILMPGVAESELVAFRDELNRRMLNLHRGDLYVALAWAPIPPDGLVDAREPAGAVAQARAALRTKLLAEKRAWFAQQAVNYYSLLFGSLGEGGGIYAVPGDELGPRNLCEVCHGEVSEGTRTQREPSEPGERRPTLCHQCASFEDLAWRLGRVDRLVVEELGNGDLAAQPDLLEPYNDPTGKGKPGWRQGIETLGLRYWLLEPRDSIPDGATIIYTVNSTEDWIGQDGTVAYGLWPVANLTPWGVAKAEQRRPVRDTHLMACEDATGIPRYGVLRMDVDDLGQVVHGARLRDRDLLHVMALSEALSEFFEARLNHLVRAAAETWRSQAAKLTGQRASEDPWAKVPYILYAGGDDLLIVGTWDVLPIVAIAIREAFQEFTGGRLTLSGGIALGTEKFPIYQAAHLAGEALDKAKDWVVSENGVLQQYKDALTFLGLTVTWSEAIEARQLMEVLAKGVSIGAEDEKFPHALLGLLGSIAGQYREVEQMAKLAPGAREVVMGIWAPRLTYGLTRLGRRLRSQVLQERLQAMAGDVLGVKPVEGARQWQKIRYLGLPVRWAEFLVRKEESRYVKT